MKKIIVLLTALFFASIATAENESIFDTQTGSVEIPVLSIKGQSKKISVILQRQDAENLIFKVTTKTDTLIDSSSNEATFDPETKTLIIPTLVVLDQGEPSKIYSIELKQIEEQIFEVLQIQPITQSIETSGLSPSVKTASKWCTGKPSQNIDEAKQSFKDICGEEYDDQKGHGCEYKTDGFHCNGNTSKSIQPSSIDNDFYVYLNSSHKCITH